ncbi:MAG: TIGR02206 family membrane protein [Anaerolineaceae bacterium]|nr:TIGR02206 family membrane protein [Anaerolineaceae bacterium]
METFFGLEFSGGPFVLFSIQHWVAIIGIIATGIWMVISQKKASESSRKVVRYFLAGILIVNESLWHIWNLTTGQWTIQTMLPLHLCSALVWACAYMLITKDERIYPFAYLIGIAGALQAILTPDLGQYAFPHFRYFQVFLSHGAIILSAVYMTLVEGCRPTIKSVKQVAIYGNLYLVCVFILNQIIGSNYLFIAHKPETASLLDVLPPWPYYILIIELLAAVFIFLFYAPFMIKDWLVKRKTVLSTSVEG